MLPPDSRTTAFELIRPPSGYRLDFAVLTTYTLDLEALLVLPLSVLAHPDGGLEELLADPLRLHQAIRSATETGQAATSTSSAGFIAATDDNRFRALEAATGRELWADRLDQRGNADPMTYLGADGRQYVVIAATDTIVAYALPYSGRRRFVEPRAPRPKGERLRVRHLVTRPWSGISPRARAAERRP